MGEIDIQTLLTSDSRFTKRGRALLETSIHLSEVFLQESIASIFETSLMSLKYAARLLNSLMYFEACGELTNPMLLTVDNVSSILHGDFSSLPRTVEEYELKDTLKSDYIDFHFLSVGNYNSSKEGIAKQFFQQFIKTKPVANPDILNAEYSPDYWINSVQLDYPDIPVPDVRDVVGRIEKNGADYVVYSDYRIPSIQCQITAATQLSDFSDKAVLSLFPAIRLYTRSPYMYQPCDACEFDDDLGVVFKISGHTKKQVIKNIIEYPHLEFLDRWVKIKGRMTTLPFWKHIEIDGQIVPTVDAWKQLKDTKDLPCTESFMNEYVTRKYLLDREKGVVHKYPLRADLRPFLTLYAPESYYASKGYSSLEIGKKCIEARIAFKRSLNPILHAIETSSNHEELSLY